jgi:hypothetical protein
MELRRLNGPGFALTPQRAGWTDARQIQPSPKACAQTSAILRMCGRVRASIRFGPASLSDVDVTIADRVSLEVLLAWLVASTSGMRV